MNNTTKDIVAWYERKTEGILRKYGPGPRVHFHTGIIEPSISPDSDMEGLRKQLVQSQERLLLEATKFWDAKRNLRGVVLDVGCGLGGSSIFLAQKYGVHVFALTNVPGHLKYVDKFAAQAGVQDKITSVFGDACAIPVEQAFDAVVAIESSCYLNRKIWFEHLAQKTHSKSLIFIADCFTETDEVRKPFDEYWLTQIGSLDDYKLAAKAACFNLTGLLDLTAETTRFWEFSVLHSRRLLDDSNIQEREEKRLRRSIKWQSQLLKMWNDRKIMCALLKFQFL